MQDAYIVDAVRTPFGKHNGSFTDTHPQDLGVEPLVALEERNAFVGSEDIEDVIYGCVVPVDEQGLNIGRIAPMVAAGATTCQASSSIACAGPVNRRSTSPPAKSSGGCPRS